eukprot:15423156-Heterocapsa_arctica.AAC.1
MSFSTSFVSFVNGSNFAFSSSNLFFSSSYPMFRPSFVVVQFLAVELVQLLNIVLIHRLYH